jgi:hypothetical protein
LRAGGAKNPAVFLHRRGRSCLLSPELIEEQGWEAGRHLEMLSEQRIGSRPSETARKTKPIFSALPEFSSDADFSRPVQSAAAVKFFAPKSRRDIQLVPSGLASKPYRSNTSRRGMLRTWSANSVIFMISLTTLWSREPR